MWVDPTVSEKASVLCNIDLGNGEHHAEFFISPTGRSLVLGQICGRLASESAALLMLCVA